MLFYEKDSNYTKQTFDLLHSSLCTNYIYIKNRKKNLTSKIFSGAGYSPNVFFITVSLAFLKTKSLAGPTESGTLCDRPKTNKLEDTLNAENVALI